MTTGESSDPYYDLIDDFDLIVASFQSQYGLRLSQDLKGMKWAEFRALLEGLDPNSPIGRVISIRAENDPKIIKYYTKEQQRIRNEWRLKKTKKASVEDMGKVLDGFKAAFLSMAGGGRTLKR